MSGFLNDDGILDRFQVRKALLKSESELQSERDAIDAKLFGIQTAIKQTENDIRDAMTDRLIDRLIIENCVADLRRHPGNFGDGPPSIHFREGHRIETEDAS